MSKTTIRAAALIGVSVIALSGAATFAASNDTSAPLRPQTAIVDDGYAELVEAVMPAVVNVRVTGEESFSSDLSLPDLEPRMRDFLERFFGQQWGQSWPHGERQSPPSKRVRGEGSGFFIDAAGHVVTNAHVVRNSAEIEVVAQDGSVYEAERIGIDEKTDLALLRIETDTPTPYVAFADSDEVRVGQRVVAVGNPFGLGGTVTSGIVSATGRELGSGPYDDFLQIDASINRGNSGGPAFNLEGEVVGINSMIYSPSGGSVGIGFAIASNLARDVIDDLLDDGQIERGWLGVTIQPVDADLALALGLEDRKGVLISSVQPVSPAAKAGIEPGDVVIAIGDEPVARVRDVTRKVAAIEPGTDAALTVLRQGEELRLDVDIGTMPGSKTASLASTSEEADQPRIGVRLAELDVDRAERLGVDGGVLVVGIEPGSPAERKDIRRGDVLLEVDGKSVSTPEDVIGAVRASYGEGDKALLVRLHRDGNELFFAIPLTIS